MEFIGRKEQLKKLKNEFIVDGVRLDLIYGRRRVGKSELVKQALATSDVRSIYYECKQTSEANNAESLGALVSEYMGFPKLGMSNFEELLDYLFRLSSEEKLVLVLDEYPYLRENMKGIDSIIQTLVDKYRDMAGLTLVLLGSYVEVMKSLMEHANPLFGRVDLVINLKPMDYYESSLFYPGFSAEDKVRIYSVFGGIPYFNKLIDGKKTVEENIIELIASPDARLENEVSMYLKAEISKISNANEVFEALAKGYSRYSDILSQSHVSSGPTLVDVLDKLIKMEVVEKTAPINDEKNKKKTGYYISDNLSLFYYKYIFRYASQLKIMNPEVFYAKYIRDDFEEKYVPAQFENIAKQYLIRKNRAGLMNPIFEKIGKYYYDDAENHTNGEFDIVTEDENGYVFYEVKFKGHTISEADVRLEIEQVNRTGMSCYRYVFITRAGIEKADMQNVEHISINELFEEV
jgi:hypothetical protein